MSEANEESSFFDEGDEENSLSHNQRRSYDSNSVNDLSNKEPSKNKSQINST